MSHIPHAPLNRILIVYQELGVAMKHGSFTYSRDRVNPLMMVKHEDGLMKYRLRFSLDGSLIGWDQYEYLRVTDTFSASIENYKYNQVKILDGNYSAQMVEKLILGIKVKDCVDTQLPPDVK